LVNGGLVPYRLLNRYKAPLKLDGRRLVLRSLVVADYEACREVRARNRDWQAIGGTGQDERGDRASFALSCARQTRWRRLGSNFGFGIFLSDRFVGEIGLRSIERGPVQSAEIGLWVDQELAGQRLGPEAVMVLVQFAFDVLGLHRLQFLTTTSNTASRRMGDKFGFRFEGTFERYLCVRGVWEDCLVSAVTAEEWAERRGALLGAWLAPTASAGDRVIGGFGVAEAPPAEPTVVRSS